MLIAGPSKDAYNKQNTGSAGRGTLIQNWQEEQVLRETTGLGRTVANGHLVKKHEDLFQKPPEELKDIYAVSSQAPETHPRVFGQSKQPSYTSEFKASYTAKKPLAPGVGKKFELIQKQFLDTIGQELNYQQNEEDTYFNSRSFNTTYGQEFVKKDAMHNTVGRRVMKDQNGATIIPDSRDIDLITDHGFTRSAPLANPEDLTSLVKKENYVTSKPITFWTEKVNEGAYYNSKPTNENAHFTRNNDFVKTFHHYTHVKL
jgi:hypothetical protein